MLDKVISKYKTKRLKLKSKLNEKIKIYAV